MECWLHSCRAVTRAVTFRPLVAETRFRVGFVVGKVAQWQVSGPVFLCPHVIIIAPMLFDHLFMSSTVYRVTYWHRRDITLTLSPFIFTHPVTWRPCAGEGMYTVRPFWSVNFVTSYKVFGVLQLETKLKVRWVAESSRVFSYSSFLPFPAHFISNAC
jgi:hypothetical protein